MQERLWRAALILAGAIGLGAPAAGAEQDPDWPCVQRLVPELGASQMWSGPPLDGREARVPEPVAALAAELIAPSLPMQAAKARIEAFANAQPPERRGQALKELFAAALAGINAERGRVIAGIRRYARGQRALAARLTAEIREIEAMRRRPDADGARLAELQMAREWDARIFSDRQKSLQFVCDQPVLLERRAFALARLIQDHL